MIPSWINPVDPKSSNTHPYRRRKKKRRRQREDPWEDEGTVWNYASSSQGEVRREKRFILKTSGRKKKNPSNILISYSKPQNCEHKFLLFLATTL